MLQGRIVEVQEEPDHLFKGYTIKKSGKVVPDRNVDAVRFVFEFDGYKEKHYSRWMAFNYDDRSNLYKKYLVPLVSGIKPYMNFDIQQLKDMEIQATWGESDNGYQHLETIIPKTKKIVAKIEPEVLASESSPEPEEDNGIVDNEEEIPF